MIPKFLNWILTRNVLQVREGDRQKERVGDLDVDSAEVVREKEEQLKRQEKWLESYKAKIEVLLAHSFSVQLLAWCLSILHDSTKYQRAKITLSCLILRFYALPTYRRRIFII